MARQYEIVYIFDSSLEEAQVNEHLTRFHELLRGSETPDPVTAQSHWGKRTLAYPIKNKELGYYVVVQFECEPEALPEFERALKLDEAVLRYLIVINEGTAPAAVGAALSTDEDSDEPVDEEDDE